MLDPFCGCATALVAAERLGRKWVGCDLSPIATKLVRTRLDRECGGLVCRVIHRTDIPLRTDIGEIPDYRTHRHTLYGQQEGKCWGCECQFPFHGLAVDHRIPKADGGTDHLSNLGLLCASCNSRKGTGTPEQLIAKLVQLGIRRPANA